MSYICEQASCSSATPCSKSLLVFLKAQSTEVVALLFDACASWWTQGPNAILQVKTVARIVESDAGKVICREAERIKPAAVVLGSRGRNLIQSVLQGSVGEYYYHHYKAAPVVIVPGKGAGIFGHLSDSFLGRKCSLMVVCALNVIFGCLTAFSPNYCLIACLFTFFLFTFLV
ncbi:uncharacterized protein LOC107623561 isoform X2 [Arachis ipaensis]|uniref:uncharacterized protein LOC107623561 isoform X2 n=1 Tax=Arachis ipaensis TaxID=130454 RepID=UPI000A2B4331|nr:uncharacterized protein LOC107623561 isoform X2 [Arachis ipaensis]